MTQIEIAADTPEADAFAEFLNAHGYLASIGQTTVNFIDGVSTSGNVAVNETMRKLWADYCEK